jgi:hypothetical protein
MTKTIPLALIALVVLASSAVAQAQTKEVQGLLRHAGTLNEMCRGGMDDPKQTDAACCARTWVGIRLNQLGWCYGARGQIGAEMRWHRCTGRSYRTDPADPNFCE